MPVLYTPIEDEKEAVVLTEEQAKEEKFILAKKKQALAEMLERECIGEYKIEIMFSCRRSYTKPTSGMLSIWESGSKLHGGGDAKIYFCPGKKLGVSDCEAVIPFNNSNYGHNMCPACGKVWRSEEVIGEIYGNWTMSAWAEKVHQYYLLLGCSADIYLKTPLFDIRAAAKLETSKRMGGERYAITRAAIKKVIYPQQRIITDSAGGKDLGKLFNAFLHV